MDRVYFISDAHLGAHSGEIETLKISRLHSFLEAIRQNADVLYIVGDLYDFWFEYRSAIPKVNLKILSMLSRLMEEGTEVRYFTGNHDLWQGEFLAQEIGIKFYDHPSIVQHNALKLFVAHGDGLTPGQWQMRLLKRVLRNGSNIFLYRLLHPDLGIPIARFFSLRSKEKPGNKYLAEYREFAMHKLDDGVDAVILGHTHDPLFENVGSKYYINLGDWVTNFTYLHLVDKKLELKTWHG